MLLHPAYRILAAVLPLVAYGSASSSDASSDTSTYSLWDLVPECAQSCVENFVKSEYTPEECTSPSSVKCLCRTKTPSGLTIGEAALTCVHAVCPQTVIKSSDVYHICDSVSDAIPETHATITATTFPSVLPTTTTDATTTDSTTTSDHISKTTLTTTTTMTSTSPSLSPEITIYHPSSSGSGAVPEVVSTEPPSAAPSNPSSASNEKGDKHVSPGTVIGVSVVSGVAGSFIIGVAVFFCCKRWKRNNRIDPDPDLFEIGGVMSEPPGFSQPSSRRSTPGPDSGPSPIGATAHHPEVSEPPRTFQPTSRSSMRLVTTPGIHHSEQLQGRDQIGFAVSSDSEWEISPRTLSSQHTLSEPLPNQAAGLYPKPLKWSHRPVSGETLFEEDELHQAVSERKPSNPQRSGSPSLMTGLPPNPRALKDGFPAQRFRRVPGQQPNQNRVHQPDPQETRLGLPIPRSAFRGSSTSNSSSTPMESSSSSHHTSSNTLLTTPFSTAQGRTLSGTSPRRIEPPAPTPSLGTLGPAAEIVSRPRIVRANDIKRVQIRSSPRPPSEVVAPYCPEDFWLERGRVRAPPPAASTDLPYPSEACPGAVLYPSSPKKRPQDAPNRVSPTSRNLTPSKRGQDLILRVD